MDVKPGYKQTEVGVVPEDWDVRSLGSVAAIAAGGTPSRSVPEYWNGNIPWVTTTEIDFNLIIDTSERITDLGVKNSAAKLLCPGTLLLALYGQGTTRGKVAMLGVHSTTNQACASIALQPVVSRSFVFHFLVGNYRATRNLSNSGSQENLSGQIIRSIAVPFPPTKVEQDSIAEALSDADALIESLEQLLGKKRQLKQGAIQELLTGKRRLPEFEIKSEYKQTEVGVIPIDWKVLRISDLVTQGPQNGYSGRSSDAATGTLTLSLAATSSGYLILNSATVKHLQRMIPADSTLFLKPFDVLVQRSNTIELVGTAAVFDGPAAVYVYPDLMMRLRFKKPVTGQWFWRYANSSRGRGYFRKIAAGSTGSMPKISGERLREMPLPVAPILEQLAITTLLSEMDAEILALESKLAKARQIKQGMMQELLTGRIRLV